jgi:SAM-dependent methyltransferase
MTMTDAITELQRVIDDYSGADRTITLLEAGCGSMSKVKLSGNVHVVGIDISEMQLARNLGLYDRILGDIQKYPLPEKTFDIIICWDVLEHLERPREALENFFKACKDGGLIILGFPNLYSVKGIITKLTPHVVHIWYYKYILDVKEAGTDDTPPFRTFFRLSMTHTSIRKLARARNATVEFFAFRESPDMKYARRRFWLLDMLLKTGSIASRAVTLGQTDVAHSDCIMVLRAHSRT